MHIIDVLWDERFHYLFSCTCISVDLRINIKLLRIQWMAVVLQKCFQFRNLDKTVQNISYLWKCGCKLSGQMMGLPWIWRKLAGNFDCEVKTIVNPNIAIIAQRYAYVKSAFSSTVLFNTPRCAW